MAVQGPFKTNFGELFPHGAYALAADALNDSRAALSGGSRHCNCNCCAER